MLPVLYLISNCINYDLLICNDAGPGYAQDMGWKYIYLNDFKSADDQTVIIIDNRIQEQEISRVETIITQNANTIFFLKIVDPYYDSNITHHYYQFLSKISCVKNAYLLSVYESKELTSELRIKFQNRFKHLPYPYLKHKEINVIHKKNQIIISGSINQNIYPYRYNIWKKVTRSITRLTFFAILNHPGYPEINSQKANTHGIIKAGFIKYLAQFRYMLLCPSRCNIEFLKFNECAYAGCIPVGQAPDSYPKEIKNLFLNLRPEYLLRDTLKIIVKSPNKNILISLRSFLSQTRNPVVLNSDLKKFILENPIHSS